MTPGFDFYPLIFESFCMAMSLLALAVLAQQFLVTVGVAS